MSRDDIIYISLLLLSIVIGFLFKNSTNSRFKSFYSTLIGFLIVIIVCQWDIFHSLIVILINAIFIQAISTRLVLFFGANPRIRARVRLGTHVQVYVLCLRYLPLVSFIFTFTYLLFFRLTEHFGLPKPLAYSNAVQLILTLKIVGLAFEIHDADELKSKLKKSSQNEQSSGSEKLEENFLKLQYDYQSIDRKPTVSQIFSYCYCYIGILTGPYFKYRTYLDWLNMKHGQNIDSVKFIVKRAQTIPFIILLFLFISKYFTFQDAAKDEFYDSSFAYRVFYAAAIFTLFRLRFYIAWIFAEISCMSAGFGAYPLSSKPKPGGGPKDLVQLKDFDHKKPNVEYSFETVHNIDEYQCEVSPTVKDVLLRWNMTTQFWMANCVFRRIKIRSIGQPLTMAVSAYWHGLHAGYYLSMLTTTPCIIAERMMEKGLKTRLSIRYHRAYDFCTWFCRCRAFDYMSLGFILLRYDLTIRYWSSVYFVGHLGPAFFICLGYFLITNRKI